MLPGMPDTASITIVKRFTYRGANEEWGNTYHFTGTTPADGAAWNALAQAIWLSERACYTNANSFVKIYGYAPGNEHSVFQRDFVGEGGALATAGLTVSASDAPMAGDQAAMMRAYIKQSSKGKKVYVRKYFHGGAVKLANPDQLSTNCTGALTAHAATMLSGSLPGGAKWAGPQAETASLPVVSPFVTTRTLKRRGKRP